MPNDLAGRRILITGASGALGQVVSGYLLEMGAEVAGTARRWKSPPQKIVTIAADLSLEADCLRVVAEAQSKLGGLNALVHLVGGFAGGSAVQATDMAVWDQMMEINVGSAFRLFRHALPVLQASGAGRLIAVGSRMGIESPAGFGAYSASKAALLSLVKTISAEGKSAGFTANAVLPGVIDTPDNRAAMPQADVSKWVQPAAIASLIGWLLSDAAGDVTGALIPVYGRS